MEGSVLETVRRIGELLVSRGLRLGVAESCTGGLVGHLLTTVPGASAFLEADVVSYSTDSKVRLLGADEDVLKAHGSVSAEAARSMMRGIRERAGTGAAVAVTGVLGPESLEGKSPGLVYIAASAGDAEAVRERSFEGGRNDVKREAAGAALEVLLEVLRS